GGVAVRPRDRNQPEQGCTRQSGGERKTKSGATRHKAADRRYEETDLRTEQGTPFGKVRADAVAVPPAVHGFGDQLQCRRAGRFGFRIGAAKTGDAVGDWDAATSRGRGPRLVDYA